jgi:hypothetical protein
MKVQLVDPSLGKDDARLVPVLADHGLDVLVPAGAVIDVPPAVAGKAPHWRKPVDGDDLAFMETKVDEDGETTTVHDLGSGLLAQVDIWAKPGKTDDSSPSDNPPTDGEQIATTEGQAR